MVRELHRLHRNFVSKLEAVLVNLRLLDKRTPHHQSNIPSK